MNLPNLLTLARIVIVPFFFTQLVSYQPGDERHRLIALTLLVAACISDALDGFLARALKQQTRLGTFLDPLADKLLLLSGFLGLLFIPQSLKYPLPLWITVTIVFRELVITIGLLLIFLVNGKVDIRPNFLGKSCTAMQMLTLCSIIIGLPVALPLAYLTAFLTAFSCSVYAYRELKKIQGVVT